MRYRRLLRPPYRGLCQCVCELVHTCAGRFAAAWTGRSRNLVADPGRNCMERTIILAECRPARFSGGAMEPSIALPIALLGRGTFRKKPGRSGPTFGGTSADAV